MLSTQEGNQSSLAQHYQQNPWNVRDNLLTSKRRSQAGISLTTFHTQEMPGWCVCLALLKGSSRDSIPPKQYLQKHELSVPQSQTQIQSFGAMHTNTDQLRTTPTCGYTQPPILYTTHSHLQRLDQTEEEELQVIPGTHCTTITYKDARVTASKPAKAIEASAPVLLKVCVHLKSPC